MALSAEESWLLETAGNAVGEFYAAIGIPLPAHGTSEATVRCFANASAHSREDRDPSCSVNLLTGLWKCHGCGESGNAYNAALAVGYSEVRARELARRFGLFLEVQRDAKSHKPKLPGERQLGKWRHTLRERSRTLARLQELKGWQPGAVVRLGLGWDGERITFPIRDHKLKIAGVARYLPGGSPKMVAVPGSRRDLFPAPELIHCRHPLFVVEGETDAVAVWSCGLKAVAVPGAGAWRGQWAQRLLGRRVVVLCDADRPGRELGERIAADVSAARVVDVEPGLSDGSDIGDWVREAAVDGGVWQVRRVLESLI